MKQKQLAVGYVATVRFDWDDDRFPKATRCPNCGGVLLPHVLAKVVTCEDCGDVWERIVGQEAGYSYPDECEYLLDRYVTYTNVQYLILKAAGGGE